MFVSPDYFSMLRIPLNRGRGFEPDEARAEARVAVISAAAARALWPGADPLGKTVRVLMTQEIREDAMTRGDLVSNADIRDAGEDVVVIGVAADVVTGLVYEAAARMYTARLRLELTRRICSSADEWRRTSARTRSRRSCATSIPIRCRSAFSRSMKRWLCRCIR